MTRAERNEMSRLLQIDSSSRSTSSITRQLTTKFVNEWKKAHASDEIIKRDLMVTQPRFVSELHVAGTYTPAELRTPEMKEELAINSVFVDEFIAADVYVIGAPMYNFTVPAVLKAYIDLIVVAGKTFSYETGVPLPLLKNKRAFVITASGGSYEGPAAVMNFVEPYLVKILGFIGITEIHFIAVRGHGEAEITASTNAAIKEIEKLVSESAVKVAV